MLNDSYGISNFKFQMTLSSSMPFIDLSQIFDLLELFCEHILGNVKFK